MTHVYFNRFIDVVTRFSEIKSNKIKLTDSKNNQINFPSKLSDTKIGGKKSDKQ